MKENKLLIWDIDGTLLHCGCCGRDALNQTFFEMYGLKDVFSKAKIGGALDAVILNEILKATNTPSENKGMILEKYGQVLKQILDEYQNNILLPGIKNILDYVEQHDNIFNTITTSNFEIGARIKLDSHDLNVHFPTGGFGDIERKKWEAAIEAIQKSEELYGVDFIKENIYIIGDTWYDIECAKKLGAQSISVATGWVEYDILKEYSPDYIFRDFSDYNQFIDIILD